MMEMNKPGPGDADKDFAWQGLANRSFLEARNNPMTCTVPEWRTAKSKMSRRIRAWPVRVQV